MNALLFHLPVLPIILPLITSALLLLVDERRHRAKAAIAVASTLGTVSIALALLWATEQGSGSVATYRLGDWPATIAITLVADRLSALMLTVTGMLALTTLIFSLYRWEKAGPHFHSLFQLLMTGLNGTFLTGDLFNLFVFFEILLASSYGLMLHGSGRTRVRMGLHYIAVNLVASAIFLIGVSLIYGVTGTLSMAAVAAQVPSIVGNDSVLFQIGAALLGTAFLVKAGMWPLALWLPGTYSAAAPPIAAFSVILTKVGAYVLLRLALPDADGAGAPFGSTVLVVGGMMTAVFGSVGVLASQQLSRLASYCVLISSGTILASIGLGGTPLVTAMLFYLVTSTLAIGGFFMLIELTERGRPAWADMLAVTMEAYGEEDEEEKQVGATIPATMAVLGLCFSSFALLIAGLPPFAGFFAKFLMLQALLSEHGATVLPWMFAGLLLVSSFAVLIAMVRAAIRSFWLPLGNVMPQIGLVEIAPIVGLLALCIGLTIGAGPTLRFMRDTAATANIVNNIPALTTGAAAPSRSGTP